MLVLTRCMEESIMIEDNVEITVIGIKKDQVRIGITAPRDVAVFRKEIWVKIKNQHKKQNKEQLGLINGKHQ